MPSQFLTVHPTRPGYQETSTVEVSAGAASADAIPSLNANGTLDPSVMPPGITAPSFAATAVEALPGGSFVNVVPGTTNVRLADASTNRPAHGYVKVAVSNAAAATVFMGDINDGLAGLTAGNEYWLGAAGQPTNTVPVTAGEDRQYLGVAVSATAISVDIREPILLA